MITKRDLERFVYAWNTPLRDVVETMDVVILLRNVHPIYRSALATELRNSGLLDKSEAEQFITYTR